LSGPGGAILRRFDSSTGQVILEKQLHAPHEDHIRDRGDFDITAAIDVVEGSQDIVTFTRGHTVQRVGESGKVLWRWEFPHKM
jgi:hypothetical protein